MRLRGAKMTRHSLSYNPVFSGQQQQLPTTHILRVPTLRLDGRLHRSTSFSYPAAPVTRLNIPLWRVLAWAQGTKNRDDAIRLTG